MVGTSIRVVVIDDQRTVTEALREALDTESGIVVVGSAEGPDAALALLGRDEVDVICLKLDNPGTQALEFTRDALARWPQLGIVVVTPPHTDEAALDAITRGARGWVSQGDTLASLVAAVRSVGAGELHLPTAALSHVLAAPRPLRQPDEGSLRVALLSPRQTDVLLCLMRGLSQAETGKALAMSPNTVRTHVQAILRRLGVHSTLAAVALARRSGLAGPVHATDSTPPPPAGSSGPLARAASPVTQPSRRSYQLRICAHSLGGSGHST